PLLKRKRPLLKGAEKVQRQVLLGERAPATPAEMSDRDTRRYRRSGQWGPEEGLAGSQQNAANIECGQQRRELFGGDGPRHEGISTRHDAQIIRRFPQNRQFSLASDGLQGAREREHEVKISRAVVKQQETEPASRHVGRMGNRGRLRTYLDAVAQWRENQREERECVGVRNPNSSAFLENGPPFPSP